MGWNFESYSRLEFILKKSNWNIETLHSQYISLWINIVVLLNVPFNYIIFWSWLFVKRSLSYRFSGCCFQSYITIACRRTQNATCIKWIWGLEVKCTRKWFRDLFLLVFIQTLELRAVVFQVNLKYLHVKITNLLLVLE